MSLAAIRKLYGFDFPSDLEEFHRVAKKHLPAMFDAGLSLAGPLFLLSKGKLGPDLGRWPADPPELFTVLEGDTDGLHFGYVLHEPGKPGGYVARFYGREGYPIEPAGPTLARVIESYVSEVLSERAAELAEIREVGEDDKELARAVRRLAVFASALREILGKTRPFRAPKETTPTLDGLGLRAPKATLEALDGKKLHAELRDEKKRGLALARGYALLQAKKPGAALQLARDALAILPTKDQDGAVLLAIAAYEALGRPLLARTFAARLPGIQKRARGGRREPAIDNRFSSTMKDALSAPKKVARLLLEEWRGEPETPDLDVIATFENLELLVLRGYALGDLPASFAKLQRLRTLELFQCKLSALPKVLAKLPKLTELKIIQDASGRSPARPLALPKGLSFPKLETLSLVACGLAELPDFVVRCKQLAKLDLNANRLVRLPESIKALTELRYLSLAGNALTELPEAISALAKLESLWLGKNRLTALPDAIAKLPLTSLDLDGNPLAKDEKERARTKGLARKAKIYWA